MQATKRARARLARLLSPVEVRYVHGVTVARPPDDVYTFLRDPNNLPRFLCHAVEIASTGGPGFRLLIGMLECEGTLSDLLPPPSPLPAGGGARSEERVISWQVTAPAELRHTGELRLRPAARPAGTEIRVTLTCRRPFWALGRVLGRLPDLWRGEPDRLLFDDLRRLKQILESDTQPSLHLRRQSR